MAIRRVQVYRRIVKPVRATPRIDTTGLPFEKGPRRRIKVERNRHEGSIIKAARAEAVERDGDCRLYVSDAALRAELIEKFGAHSGPPEFSHYNRTHRRSKTVGQPPEERHQSKHALILCAGHADEYDENRMDIEETTADGCDGPLTFTRGPVSWTEPPR